MVKFKNQNADKWAWATPEKLNPNYKKEVRTGALILAILGLCLCVPGFFITLYVSQFIGVDELKAKETRDSASFIFFIAGLPFSAGIAMLSAGMKELVRKLTGLD